MTFASSFPSRAFPFRVGADSIGAMLRGYGRWYAGSVLAVGLLLSTSSVFAQPADPNLEQAKVHMTAGTAFYKEAPVGHKCEEAAAEFEKAYALSGSWKALRALAICELLLERDAAAIAHFEEVLSKGGKDVAEEDRKQIGEDLNRLKASLATLTISINAPAARLTATRQASDGSTKTNRFNLTANTSLGIHPGAYTFTAAAEGFPDVTWTAEVGNGSKLERTIEFKTAPTPPGGDGNPNPNPPPGGSQPVMERPIPVSVWIMTGVTGAAAIGWGVTAGLSAAAKSDYDEQNGNASAATLEDLRDDVITKNIVADVLLGTTIAAAGVTLILFFTRPEVEVTPSQEQAFEWTIAPSPLFDESGSRAVGAAAMMTGSFQ